MKKITYTLLTYLSLVNMNIPIQGAETVGHDALDSDPSICAIRQAISLARTDKPVNKQEVKASSDNYMCAFLDEGSEAKIEGYTRKILENIPMDKYSSSLLSSTRQPNTVANFALKEWWANLKFHMTLKGEATEAEKEALISVLRKIEFACSDIKLMGRFLAIQLDFPTCLEGVNELSPIEGEYISKHLDFIQPGKSLNRIPMMHISLAKLNDRPDEMPLLNSYQNQTDTTIPGGPLVLQAINENNRVFHLKERNFGEAVSKIVIHHLNMVCNDTREALSKVSTMMPEKVLLKYINKQSDYYQRQFVSIARIAQEYMREEFDFPYNFSGMIGFKVNGKPVYDQNIQLIQGIFSNMFLKKAFLDENKDFTTFKQILTFYIERLETIMDTRRNEIKNGRAIAKSFETLFDDTPDSVSLTPEEILIYERKNGEDLSCINKLNEALSGYFIKYFFFGLNLDNTYFESLRHQNEFILGAIQKYEENPINENRDFALSACAKLSEKAIKINMLNKGYLVNSKNIDTLLTTEGLNFITINSEKFTEMKENLLEKLKGNKEPTSFKSSKLPDIEYWNQIISNSKDLFNIHLKSTKVRFSALNTKTIDNSHDEDC